MELSTNRKNYLAFVKKQNGEKMEIPINQEDYDEIIKAPIKKKSHVLIDGATYFTSQVTVGKMTDEYRHMISDENNKISYYTDEDRFFGRLKTNKEIRVSKFERIKVTACRFTPNQIMKTWYTYYDGSKIVTVDLSEIEKTKLNNSETYRNYIKNKKKDLLEKFTYGTT